MVLGCCRGPLAPYAPWLSAAAAGGLVYGLLAGGGELYSSLLEYAYGLFAYGSLA